MIKYVYKNSNKPLLYVSFFLSFLLFIYEMSKNHLNSIAMYVLIYIILQAYSNNLELIISLSFVITLSYVISGKRNPEGFEPIDAKSTNESATTAPVVPKSLQVM